MSEKKLGTCDDLQDVKHPYDSFECRNWQPCEPVASPQATRPFGDHTVRARCEKCGKIWVYDRREQFGRDRPLCPECDAPQPAAGTTPLDDLVTQITPENVHKEQPSEGTTPQAEGPHCPTCFSTDREIRGAVSCGRCGRECNDCEDSWHRAVAPVETPLTAEQFLEEYTRLGTSSWYVSKEVLDICKFAEAFRDKSEAGLRAKLAEQRQTMDYMNLGWAAMKRRAEAAQAEVAALRERERWIPVEEKLPFEGEWALVCFMGDEVNIGVYSVGDWYSVMHECKFTEKFTPVTHWKALSAAPERP